MLSLPGQREANSLDRFSGVAMLLHVLATKEQAA